MSQTSDNASNSQQPVQPEPEELLRNLDIERQLRFVRVTAIGDIKTIEGFRERIAEFIEWKIDQTAVPVAFHELNRRYSNVAKKLGTCLRDEINNLITTGRLIVLPSAFSSTQMLLAPRAWYNSAKAQFPDETSFVAAIHSLMRQMKEN